MSEQNNQDQKYQNNVSSAKIKGKSQICILNLPDQQQKSLSSVKSAIEQNEQKDQCNQLDKNFLQVQKQQKLQIISKNTQLKQLLLKQKQRSKSLQQKVQRLEQIIHQKNAQINLLKLNNPQNKTPLQDQGKNNQQTPNLTKKRLSIPITVNKNIQAQCTDEINLEDYFKIGDENNKLDVKLLHTTQKQQKKPKKNRHKKAQKINEKIQSKFSNKYSSSIKSQQKLEKLISNHMQNQQNLIAQNAALKQIIKQLLKSLQAFQQDINQIQINQQEDSDQNDENERQ